MRHFDAMRVLVLLVSDEILINYHLGVWLVLDERIDDVILGTLNIEGVLEFEQGLDLLLNAHCILVLGGR